MPAMTTAAHPMQPGRGLTMLDARAEYGQCVCRKDPRAVCSQARDLLPKGGVGLESRSLE